jgi:hypothetical protein
MVSDNDVFVGHDEEVTYEPKDEMHVCWSTPSAVAERGVALGEAPKKKIGSVFCQLHSQGGYLQGRPQRRQVGPL